MKRTLICTVLVIGAIMGQPHKDIKAHVRISNTTHEGFTLNLFKSDGWYSLFRISPHSDRILALNITRETKPVETWNLNIFADRDDNDTLFQMKDIFDGTNRQFVSFAIRCDQNGYYCVCTNQECQN